MATIVMLGVHGQKLPENVVFSNITGRNVRAPFFLGVIGPKAAGNVCLAPGAQIMSALGLADIR